MNELISREAVKEMMKNHRVDFSTEKDYRTARACANAVPPSEPKRGKWIRDGHHIRCDQCGIYMCDTDREGDKIPNDFCPNCGSYNGGEINDQ